MKIAVVKTGGKQYKVSAGQLIKVEKLAGEPGDQIGLETLLIVDGDQIDLGAPSLGAKVEAKIVGQGKAEKIRVIKYKSKTRYKRTLGHRQRFTQLEISKIA